MTRTRGAVATSLATLLVVASAVMTSAAEAGPDDVTGIDWTLTTISVDGTITEVPAEVGASLRLEDGQATGSGGCNQFFGDYELEGSSLTFGPLGSTKRLCPDPVQSAEDAYLVALGSVGAWEIGEDGSLRLLDSLMQPLLAFSAADDVGIEGTGWLLQEQSVEGAAAAVPDGLLVSLRMQAGEAGGSAGCNSYSASYVIDGDSLTFGPIASTLMACEGPAGEVEASYLANLDSVASWASDGASLTLSDADGAAVLTYNAAPEATIVGSWMAQGINNGAEAVVSSAMTPMVTAEFSLDGELTGDDGCNEYFGSYQVDGDAIAIDLIGSTRRACGDAELETQAAEYQAALASATTWAVTDAGMLELRDDGGALQVSYLPAER